MPNTVIGPAAEAFPKPVYSPVVQGKISWGDDWFFFPELRLVSATTAASGQELDSCTIKRVYGPVKLEWETAFSTRASWVGGMNRWIRICLVGAEGYEQVWIGRIAGESRDVHGADAGPSGEQTWQCYGPRRMLEKIAVSTCFWRDPDDVVIELGWVPGMNDRDGRGALVGNRNAVRGEDDPCYYYGGEYVWTNYDALEYLLAKFVDQSAADGPSWTLGGQADLLKKVEDVIRWDTTQTLAEMIRRLIPIKYGIDYTIVSTDDGFEIFVYALSSRERTFAGVTLPRNPNTVEIRTSETADCIRVNVVTTANDAYSRIRILGRKIVVCCSICGSAVDQAGLDAGTIREPWAAAAEDAYLLGAGPEPFLAEVHDQERRKEEYRAVYRQFSVTTGWDFQGGEAAPVLDDEGQLVPGLGATKQQTVLRSLPWLPLYENWDYTQDPPVDNNAADVVPELMKPAVWIAEVTAPWHASGVTYYRRPEDAGIGVSVLQNDLGVFLSSNPNHRIASTQWAARAHSISAVEPEFDCKNMVATLAFETDHRLMLTCELPGGATIDGGTIDIEVGDAECWILCANTVVQDGSTPANPGLQLSPVVPVVIRNDADRLALVMAGAISRYGQNRARASITVKGLLPWGGLVGQILTLIEEGGDRQHLDAPITSVTWTSGKDPMTVVKTGFAV